MKTIRQRLADAITRNGGYYADRSPFALEYTVSIYRADTSKENLVRIIRRGMDVNFELFEDPGEDLRSLEDMALESLREGLSEDTDNYRTLGAKACALAGLSHTPWPRKLLKPNPDSPHSTDRKWRKAYAQDVDFLASYGLYGRGGKHLCIEEFEGKSLQISGEDLVDRILDPEESQYYDYTNEWCRRLLAAMSQWDEEFTTKEASQELEEMTAWELLGWSESCADAATDHYK